MTLSTPTDGLTLEQARQIVINTSQHVKRWGKQANPPYTQQQLMRALTVIADHVDFDAPTAAEHTKIKRQLAACAARVVKLAKKAAPSSKSGRDNDDGTRGLV